MADFEWAEPKTWLPWLGENVDWLHVVILILAVIAIRKIAMSRSVQRLWSLFRRRRLRALRAWRQPWVLRHSAAVMFLGLCASAAVFALVFNHYDLPTRDRFDVAIKSATALAAATAGALTWGRLELSRHEHRLQIDRDLIDRYGKSVELLSNDDTLIRLGGLYTLERFALDAARSQP